MTWTTDELRAVSNALLGSWPGTITTWGKEAFAAYLAELQARALTPDAVLTAIRSAAGQFPPSAPELAALARKDPDRPTFDELLAELYGPGGVFGFRRRGVTLSPWTLKFVDSYGLERLRMEPVADPDEGKWARKRIEEAYAQFCEATDGREVHEVASRSARGSLGRPDFAGAIGRGGE